MENQIIIYDKWLKTAPKQLNAGLSIIKKIKGKNDYIILLGGTYRNQIKKYEMLGGRCEPQDKTALHTAVREFIEELFNIKLHIDKIDELVRHLILNSHIAYNLTQISETSVSYFTDFKTLELIYNFVYYGKYNSVHSLNFTKFMQERNSNKLKCEKSDGLCEIDFVSVVYLSKAHLLPLRKYAYYILVKLSKKLEII